MLLFLATTAQATIVNVLTPSIGPIEDGWHGSVKAGGSVVQGNERRIGASLAAGLQFKRKKDLFRLKTSADGALAFGDVVSQRAFINARHRHTLKGPVSSLLFVQVDHNRFRGLTVRDLVGGGVDIRTWRAEWTEAHTGLSVMAEQQLHAEGFVDDDSGLRARFSGYFTVAAKTETVVFASTTFLQPRIDRPGNWRLLEDLSMTLDISKHLDWNVLLKIERDSRPPTGVEPLDVALTSGLVASF